MSSNSSPKQHRTRSLHIRELIDILGENGGYIMAPAHEILGDVPAENIAAWIETTRGHS